VSPGAIVENGYSLYSIRFMTDGREAIATAAVPLDLAPPPGGFHVVANAHGTTGVADACATTGTTWGAGLAGLFGARGLVGVAPDYPGLGTEGPHPYVVSKSDGRAVLDALRATGHLGAFLGVPMSGRAAAGGLSQGGHAVIAAAAEHAAYAPELDVRAFAAAGPASAWLDHWKLGVGASGPHLVYHALLAYAWAQHYGYEGPSIWAPSLAPGVDALFESACAYPPDDLAPRLDATLDEVPSHVFDPTFLAAWQSGDPAAYAFLGQGFSENALGPYTQSAPLRVYQGALDDVVPAVWTDELVDTLEAGGVEVDYVVVPGAGHTGVAFGFLAFPELRTEEALAWLRDALDAP
jgi:hypothetical protein